MIYAAHQPDLLPYSGFFYKMAKTDIFDVKIWDQFVDRGYQRRVKMRDKWVSLPLVPGPVTDPIFDKRLKPEAASFLADSIVKRYTSNGARPKFWRQRSEQVLDEVRSIRTDKLWQFNLELILLVRQMLGITTALSFSQPRLEHQRGSEGIVHIMRGFNGPMTYLSGTGARSYMGDCSEFTDAGIDVIWTTHAPVTGDSILSVLFDYEDPLSVVLAEESDVREVVA